MKMRGSVVSLSFSFPHPPEDLKKKKKKNVPIILTFDFLFFYCSLTKLVLDDASKSFVVECVVYLRWCG